MKKNLLLFISFTAFSTLFAQLPTQVVKLKKEYAPEKVERTVLPNVEGYMPLKCDFHVHTVFSDGRVWPDQRIDEAIDDGLDAIAITDHIEYQPHAKYFKGDHNSSYNIAKEQADKKNFILIKGVEITRQKPFGHMNALFIQDANAIAKEDQIESLNAALEQNAFIMWNHPGWPNDTSTLYPLHKELIAAHKIHGIEVFNEIEYYPPAIDWCNEYPVAVMGNSDVHGYTTQLYKGSRPFTIVFAAERSEKGIKEALFARRSIVQFNDILIGTPQWIEAFVKAAVSFDLTKQKLTLTNHTEIPFYFTVAGKSYLLAPLQKKVVTLKKDKSIVFNKCLIGANLPLTIQL